MAPRGRRTRARARGSSSPPPSRYTEYPGYPPRRERIIRERAVSPSPDRQVYIVRPEAQQSELDSSATVRYQVVYKDLREGRILHLTESDRPVAAPQETAKDTLRDTGIAFEVITEYVALNRDNRSSYYPYPSYTSRSPVRRRNHSPDRTPRGGSGSTESLSPVASATSVSPRRRREASPPPTYQITSLQGHVRLEIHSEALTNALQQVIKYYPNLRLRGLIRIDYPFRVLVHYENELSKFAYDRDPAIVQAEELCKKERDAFSHILKLQTYLEDTIMEKVRTERALHARGFATFEMLWLLFKPGADVVLAKASRKQGSKSGNKSDRRQGYVVQELAGGETSSSGNRKPWEVILWSMSYDGTKLGRVEYTHYIDPFEGQVELASLGISPANRPDSSTESQAQTQAMIEDGRKAFAYLEPRCMQHSGKAVEFPHHEIEGLVMVDMVTFYTDNARDRPDLHPLPSYSVGISECSCPMCAKRTPEAQARRPKFAEYDKIDFNGETKLTDHQCFLLPSSIWAFSFKLRSWELADVNNLSTARFKPDILNTLVMDEGRVKILKALAKNYKREEGDVQELRQDYWSADFVEGKGKSLIVLCHGGPGTGKTYTAETVAEYTRRPLMTLTAADIGTDPEDLEDNLDYHFSAAKAWGAIVLIDEADIYMQRRSSTALKRNSLVAGFLRALETYEGLLFLTTNRVGAFDDAFVSRIHVKLYYRPLQAEDRRKIWSSFINKLARERGRTMRVTIDAKEYIANAKAVQDLKLNGREIRNTFQTAVALADFEAEKDEEGRIMITDQHIKQVVEMSKEFKQYLEDLHRGDEGERAQREVERLPDSYSGAERDDDD